MTDKKMTAEELVEEIRYGIPYDWGKEYHHTDAQAIKLINQYTAPLQAENERLREALAPFAKFAERIENDFTSKDYPDTVPMAILPMCMNPAFTLGDCRNAKAALEDKPC